MDLAEAKKIAVEMRGGRSSMAYTAWEQQRGPAYVMDWLIAEVERLTAERDMAYAKGKEETLEQVRNFVRVRAERDKYKAALERIAAEIPKREGYSHWVWETATEAVKG